MEELFDKLENLKLELDKVDCVKKVRELNEKLKKDKELTSLLEKYHMTQDESLKKEIIKNPLFQEYKKYESDLNILILEINDKLKIVTKKEKCKL